MKWGDVGRAVAGIAPHLGAALGGPFGAIVGSAVGRSFGLESADPEKLVYAMNADQQAEMKLAELEAQYAAHVASLDAASHDNSINQVNETIRSEMKAEHWVQYSWRPFIGFTTGLSFLVVTIFCSYLGFEAIYTKSHESLNMVSDIIFSYSALFAVPGSVLGIASWNSWNRGKSGDRSPIEVISDNIPKGHKRGLNIFKRK